MTKTEVLAYYKTVKAVAAALGISESAVSQWPEIIPRLRAYEIQELTRGDLKVGLRTSEGSVGRAAA